MRGKYSGTGVITSRIPKKTWDTLVSEGAAYFNTRYQGFDSGFNKDVGEWKLKPAAIEAFNAGIVK